MSVNKKSIAAQALMEMKDIKKAIKEESKDTLKAMLSEAVKDVLRESIEDDDDIEIFDGDDEKCEECGKDKKDCCCGGKCEKKDAKKGKKESGELEEVGEEPVDGEQDPAAVQPQAGAAQAEAPADPAMNAPVQGDGEAQDDFTAQYQAGDTDTLDLTGEQDIQNVLKVYKSLPDDSQVVVVKDGNKINLQDSETGAEYIIDLGTDDAEAEAAPEAVEDGEAEQLAEDSSADDEFNELRESDDNEELNDNEMNEETLFEIDLGYTDNYQDKDPIDGLSNSEPSKSGRSWHKGIPTGTEKPWAGKGTEKKGDPFDKQVNENLTELDDDYFAAGLNDTGVAEVETEDGMPFDKKVGEVNEGGARTSVKRDHRVKSATNNGGNPQIGPTRSPNSDNADLEDRAKLQEAVKKLKAKNKKLNEAVAELHKGLREAYMTNVNLGKITKLFLENTTTQAEKLQIVERFSNEAKTPKQAQALYESISKQLSASKAPMTEGVEKSEKKEVVKESKTYKSQDLLNTIDLMNRVINL